MQYNTYFDFVAIFGFAAMTFSVIYKKTATTATGKFFLSMLIVGFISAISDILSINSALPYVVMYTANIIYLASRIFAAMSFCFYLIGITDNWHKLKTYWPLGTLLLLPFLAIIGLLASNHITNWVFYIQDGIYHRGILISYGVMYFGTLIYLATGLGFIIRYRHFFSKDKFIAILATYILSAIGLIIQVLVPQALVEIFISCLASFFILVIVERPDEIYEPEIKLKKYSAFTIDAIKALETKRTASVLFIKIMNEPIITAQSSYKEQIDIRRSIGVIIKETAIDFSLKGEFFWLGQGRYAAMLRNHNLANAKDYAVTVRRRLNVPIKCSHGIVDLYSNVALVELPENISNNEMCSAFMDSFYHISTLLDSVFDLKNISSKRDFEIKMNMENILKNAFLNDSFEIYFQPIYSVADKNFKSAEALLRLNDRHYGYIEPEVFLPEAERSGQIHKIGDYVFDAVCKFIATKEFKQSGLDCIEVNLSVVQCTHEDLPIRIMDAIKRNGIDPKHLNIDITESNDAYSHKLMEDNIRILKELGITFSLDDYGSGYSSIDHVSKLPVDIIKIDKGLINQKENPELLAIVENYIKMIHDMKRKIVIEGVETKEALLQFEEYKCDYIQGYYFTKPLPKDEFLQYISEYKEVE